MTAPRLPIAVTMGDPAGIGPEIIAKLWAEGDLPAAFVIGDEAILRRAIGLVGARVELRAIGRPGDADGAPGRLDLLPVGRLPADLPFGCIDARAGAAAYAYVARAIDLAMAGEIEAVVTAPLNKEAMKAAGIGYPGHTEILAARSGSADYAMMLANEELRVLLVSIHVSLAEAIGLVTPEAEYRAIRLAWRACRDFGIARPRIAVAGLNPHAGENGLFGREDMEAIRPAVERAQGEGIEASGPWPGDTVFMRARRGEFDIVVAQYHDQGLIPVKYLGIEQGVNVTVGLPFLRTSVDHGTAFDIAGTGKAECASLRSALRMAERMLAGRKVEGRIAEGLAARPSS
jgi:4-hydroxythreonine-4-phosphate dehydrogenase